MDVNVIRGFTHTLALGLLLMALGCSSDDSSDEPMPEPVEPSLTLESADDYFYVGDVMRIRAIYTDDTGVRSDKTADVAWGISDESLIRIDGPGVLIGLARGETTLRVSLYGESTEHTIAVKSLTEELTSIAIESSSTHVPKGYNIPISATGLYGDGRARDVTQDCTWTSLSPDVIEVRQDSMGFQLHGIEVGESAIEVSLAGMTTTVHFTVELLGLEEIEVVPFELVLPLGSTYQLGGLGRFQKGSLIDLTSYLTWESSDSSILEVSNESPDHGALLAVGEGTAVITASADGQVGISGVVVTSAHVEALGIDPAVVNIPAGTSTGLSAVAVLEGGYALDVTELASWTLADTNLATLNADGAGGLILEGIAPGETTLNISYSDAVIEQPVTIREADLLEMTIFAPFDQVPVGNQVSFFTSGIFSDNSQGNLNDVATWSSSDPEVAFVANYPEAGRATGLSAGNTVITATFGEFSVSAPLSVTAAEIMNVQILPPISSVPLGDVVSHNAIAVFSDDTVLNLADEATWASSNPGVAMISNADGQHGLANTLSVGETTITVELGEFTDSSNLTVRDAAITFAFIVPSDLVLLPGRFEQMNALANYTNGSSLLVSQEAVWLSDNPEIAQVSNSGDERGRVTGISPGTATIRIIIGETQAERTVEVLDATLLSLNIEPTELNIPAGFSVQTEAIGEFDVEIDPSFSEYTQWGVWSSEDESIATVGNIANQRGRVHALVPGETTISVGSGDVVGSTPVMVDNRQLVSMTIGPSNPIFPTDYIQPFVVFGQFDDGSSFPVTIDVELVSSDSTVATILNSNVFPGFVSTVQTGTATLTARKGDIEASTDITVVDMVAENVVVAPVSPVVPRFTPFDFSATGVFPDGTTADFTNLCIWSSSDPTLFLALDEMFVKGRVVGFNAGTGEIRVTCADIEVSTSVTFY